MVLRKFFRLTGDTDWDKDTIHRQGQVLATDEPVVGVRHAHLDHLGTIRLWTRSDATVHSAHTYTAFGEEVTPVADQELQFTGHERDPYLSEGCPAGVPAIKTVDNQTVSTGQTFTGCDEVTSENTDITSTQEVRFEAGDSITLGEDFSVAQGAVFAAEIDASIDSALQDLDYMHARYCSPHMGRFTRPDPKQRRSAAMKPQTWNKYAYARNNPMKFLDPNGEEEITFQLSTFINQATVLAPMTFGGPKSFAGGTKTFQQVTIETDRSIAGNNPIVRQSQFVGETLQRSLFDSTTTVDRGQAPPLDPASASFDAAGNVVLRMSVASGNPLVAGAPEINVTMTATVDPSGQSFGVSAGVDGFPTTAAAAVTSSGQQIPIFLAEEGATAFLLIDGLGDQEINVQCTKQDGCE